MIAVLFWLGFGVLCVALLGNLISAYQEKIEPLPSILTFLINLFITFLCLYGALHF